MALPTAPTVRIQEFHGNQPTMRKPQADDNMPIISNDSAIIINLQEVKTPTTAYCEECKMFTTTELKYRIVLATFCYCLLIWVISFGLCCFCMMAFFHDECKQRVHMCSKCGNDIHCEKMEVCDD